MVKMSMDWWRDVGFRTLVLVCLASIMERADEALLPSVYREIGIALHAGPSALGSLTLVRSLTQCLAAPVAGFLAQQYNRASIIAGGAVMWAVATVFVGISETFAQVAVSRALNGIGLGIVGPSIQSMLADSTIDSNRGEAFGWLGVAGNLGTVFGGLCAVLMADTTVLGFAGWRLAFHLVAVLSLIVGGMVHFYAVDPQYSEADPVRDKRSLMDNLKESYKDCKGVVQIKSFQLFIAQGVAGSFPWAALAFAPMWLELMGFSNFMTAALLGCWIVATSLGGLLGGMLGDFLSLKLPDTGRIMLSQISAGSAIPIGAVVLMLLPNDPNTPVVHAIGLFFLGVCISWNGSATNGPIFAEIVPEKSRTNIYALDRAFETFLSSFAPPIVGLLAERVYGYAPPPKGPITGSMVVDKKNAKALADALYTSMAIPFTICASLYCGLYWTYPIDRDRVKAQQMDLPTVAHVPLEEIVAKEDGVWTLEDDDDEEREEVQEIEMVANGNGVHKDVGSTEGETVRMLSKE